MRIFRLFVIMMVAMLFLFCSTSCVILPKRDNGRHKGWQKNSKNPHHRNNTKPGKSIGEQKNAVSINDCGFFVSDSNGGIERGVNESQILNHLKNISHGR